ncbi:exported hypothetical protein [Gammaproteobacteria bacterium]
MMNKSFNINRVSAMLFSIAVPIFSSNAAIAANTDIDNANLLSTIIPMIMDDDVIVKLSPKLTATGEIETSTTRVEIGWGELPVCTQWDNGVKQADHTWHTFVDVTYPAGVITENDISDAASTLRNGISNAVNNAMIGFNKNVLSGVLRCVARGTALAGIAGSVTFGAATIFTFKIAFEECMIGLPFGVIPVSVATLAYDVKENIRNLANLATGDMATQLSSIYGSNSIRVSDPQYKEECKNWRYTF